VGELLVERIVQPKLLVLMGEQGSAKSTFSALLRSLLDLVGYERVVIGSDAPFFAPAPGYVVDQLHEVEPLDTDVLSAIRTTT